MNFESFSKLLKQHSQEKLSQNILDELNETTPLSDHICPDSLSIIDFTIFVETNYDLILSAKNIKNKTLGDVFKFIKERKA